MGRFKPIFSKAQEKELADHIRDLEARFYGLRMKDVRSLAFQYAKLNHISHRFNEQNLMAGKHWAQDFAARNRLSLRAPEKCSLGRATGFNKVQCDRFFKNLKLVYEKTKVLSHRIFNMDETGLCTVPNKLHKSYAVKGKRTVSKIVSADRGQLVTAVCCMSASGTWVPPGLIFARKRMKEELFYGAPPGTLKMISDSGYMNTELFLVWLHHFSTFVKPSESDPVVLIMDNHISHCSLEAVLFARSHFITLLTLPPHGSHKLQPLDRVFFFPLKTAFSGECDKWMVSNPGRPITMREMAALFHSAYSKVATIEICEKSFDCTGIYPYNPDIFTAADFAPSEVTDKFHSDVDRQGQEDINRNELIEWSDEDEIPLAELQRQEKQKITIEKENRTPTNSPIFNQNQKEYANQSPRHSLSSVKLNESDPCCSVTPKMILPLPKAKYEQIRKTKSKRSEILSSTPYKEHLLEQTEEKLKAQKGKRKILKCKQASATKIDNTICPGCNENFSYSDWLMCRVCQTWWHEDCSNYLGSGSFLCDLCDK